MNSIFIALFFLTALFYSSIGFGGGSSYIAFMLLFGTPFEHIPVIALVCNLIVVTGSSFHFIKNSDFSLGSVLPLVVTSIPAAYIAGMIHIPKNVFSFILGFCLLISAVRMILKSKSLSSKSTVISTPKPFVLLITGLVLGFLSGLVGIGGGIFLSPIMYNLRWGRPKEISTLFLFFNSIAGLVGQLQKEITLSIFGNYWFVFIAVFLGGQIGSFFGSSKLRPRPIQLITSFLILFVSLRILFFSLYTL